MEYPRHLFRHPGSYGEGALSYKVAGAADEAEEAALLADGWHLTKEAAWGVDSPDKEAGKKAGADTSKAKAGAPAKDGNGD